MLLNIFQKILYTITNPNIVIDRCLPRLLHQEKMYQYFM